MTNTDQLWRVYEVRAKANFSEPGMYGYDAEARVEDQRGNVVFVHVNDYEGQHYTVSNESVYDFMNGEGETDIPAFSEEYDSLKEAEGSAYRKVFRMLAGVIDGMKEEK